MKKIFNLPMVLLMCFLIIVTTSAYCAAEEISPAENPSTSYPIITPKNAANLTLIFSGTSGYFTDLAWSSDSCMLATSSSDSEYIELWEMPSGTKLRDVGPLPQR